MSSGTRGQKVRLDDVRKLDEDFAALPEIQNQEIAKTEAIRLLLPRIQTLQARGYSLANIAERLTNGGVPMAVIMLRADLARVGALPKQRRSRPKNRPNTPKNIVVASKNTDITAGPPAEKTANTDAPKDAASPPSPGVAPKKSEDSPATSAQQPAASKEPPAPRAVNEQKTPGEAEPKRGPSSFTPRKDTDL